MPLYADSIYAPDFPVAIRSETKPEIVRAETKAKGCTAVFLMSAKDKEEMPWLGKYQGKEVTVLRRIDQVGDNVPPLFECIYEEKDHAYLFNAYAFELTCTHDVNADCVLETAFWWDDDDDIRLELE